MPLGFYRYISYQAEIDQVKRERKVYSTNPGTQYATWYCPTRHDDPATAQSELALRKRPTHRVGPIPVSEMPDFEIALRPVAPACNRSTFSAVTWPFPLALGFSILALPFGWYLSGSENRFDPSCGGHRARLFASQNEPGPPPTHRCALPEIGPGTRPRH